MFYTAGSFEIDAFRPDDCIPGCAYIVGGEHEPGCGSPKVGDLVAIDSPTSVFHGQIGKVERVVEEVGTVMVAFLVSSYPMALPFGPNEVTVMK